MKTTQGKNGEAIHNREGCLWNRINDLVFNSVSEREVFLAEALTRDYLFFTVTAKLSMD